MGADEVGLDVGALRSTCGATVKDAVRKSDSESVPGPASICVAPYTLALYTTYLPNSPLSILAFTSMVRLVSRAAILSYWLSRVPSTLFCTEK